VVCGGVTLLRHSGIGTRPTSSLPRPPWSWRRNSERLEAPAPPKPSGLSLCRGPPGRRTEGRA
jgi:hypothetical protein